MALPVPIVMHEYETPESRANRLAAGNGFRSFESFIRMTRMTSTGLVKGEPTSVQELSRWSGADVGVVGRYAAVTLSSSRTWRLGGAVFGKESRAGERFRYCPLCVVSDLENEVGPVVSRPRVRPSWTSRSVWNCVEHAVSIVEVEQTPGTGRDFCKFVSNNLSMIKAQVEHALPVTSLSVDRFLENQIRGVAGQPYLDRMPTHVASDLCSHLGALMRKYQRVSPHVPDDLHKETDREIGFHIARHGETRIRGVVKDIIETARPTGTSKFLFGPLGRWLRRNADRAEFGDVLELFQDIAVRALPYGPGEMCFVSVDKRHVHSLLTASEEYGLFHRRIAELLIRAELISDASGSPGCVYFDADVAHEILISAAQTMTSKEARLALGMSEKTMARFLKTGILPLVEARSEGRNYSRIRREDLDGLLLKLFEHVTVGEVDDDWVSLDRLCQTVRCEKDQVVLAIIDGSLKKLAAPVGHGFLADSLRLDPKEAVEHFMSRRSSISDVAAVLVMSQRESARYLRVSKNTIPYLLENGHLKTINIRNPRSYRDQTVIAVEELDAFLAEFVAVSDIAAEYETHSTVMVAAFEKLGIKPLYDNCGYVTRFFRKSDIADSLVHVPAPIRRRRKR